MQSLSIISVNIWQVLISFANLAILTWIMKKFLFKPVQKMIDDRQQEIDTLYAEGEAKRLEAEQLHADYSAQLAGAREESARMLREANASAQQQREQILREAKADAAALKEKANADIALEKKKALNDVKDDISSLALDIAEQVVGKNLSGADQNALVEEFLRDMGDLS